MPVKPVDLSQLHNGPVDDCSLQGCHETTNSYGQHFHWCGQCVDIEVGPFSICYSVKAIKYLVFITLCKTKQICRIVYDKVSRQYLRNIVRTCMGLNVIGVHYRASFEKGYPKNG